MLVTFNLNKVWFLFFWIENFSLVKVFCYVLLAFMLCTISFKCILVCLKQNKIDSCNRYDSIFMAHNGPVYGIKFSPFCSGIFITYGADWQIKIWIQNFQSPLLSLCYCVRIYHICCRPIVKQSHQCTYQWCIHRRDQEGSHSIYKQIINLYCIVLSSKFINLLDI